MEGKHFLETWDIHNRVNLYILEAVEPEHLKDVSSVEGAKCWRAVCSYT